MVEILPTHSVEKTKDVNESAQEILKGKKKLDHMKELVVDTELLKQEHRMDVNELKQEIENDSSLFEQFEEEILDIFPDFDENDFSLCMDELKKIRLLLGTRVNTIWLRQKLLEIKNKVQEEQEEEGKSKTGKSIANEIHQGFLADTLEIFSNKKIKTFVKEQMDFLSFLVYLQNHHDELDKEQKRKLQQWFEAFMAWFKEGNALEIYEIQIVDGKIIIKGSIDGKNVTLVYDVKAGQFSTMDGLNIDVSKMTRESFDREIDSF